MPKFIAKTTCKYDQGYIVKKDEVVGIPTTVRLQLEKLECMIQQHKYLKDQGEYHAGPSLEGFKRTYAFDVDMPYVEAPETPVSDARVEEAMKFMAEADAVNDVAVINSMLDRFRNLIEWCRNDKFIEGDYFGKIDLYELGDPLKLDADKIVEAISDIVKSPVEIVVEV